MSEIPNDERKAGLGLASKVDELAMAAPDVFAESVLHTAAHKLRRRYGYSRDLKQKEILRRLQKEPLGITVADLQKSLGFHKDDVLAIVRDLESMCRVSCKKVLPGGSKGGRPTTLVSLVIVRG